jgi:hypothetical protein
MAAGLHDQIAGVRLSLACSPGLGFVFDGIVGAYLLSGSMMPKRSHAASIELRCLT